MRKVSGAEIAGSLPRVDGREAIGGVQENTTVPLVGVTLAVEYNTNSKSEKGLLVLLKT